MSNKEFDPDKVKQGKVKQEKIDQNEIDQDNEFVALHEEYQAVSTEMPAESTDLNILNAAHSAVNSQHEADHVITPVKIKKVKKHAWYVPVSYVAIIVLSLSVFLKLAFEPELIDAELNGADFAEEAFLPETNRQFTDKQDGILSEQKIITEKHQQQITELQKERMQASARQKSKEKTAPKKRLLLKQQAASPSMSSLPRVKREIVNDNARAGTEGVPAMTLMSLPESEKNQQAKTELSSTVEPDALSTAEADDESAVELSIKSSVVSSVASSVGSGTAADSGLESLDKRVAENELQNKQINELIKLFETKQLEKLKQALVLYRKTYPYIKETDLLPLAIQDQEKRWQLENEVKSLHN